jgi:ubiquinone/menaquinone biosynthesis C-methylase UbiE
MYGKRLVVAGTAFGLLLAVVAAQGRSQEKGDKVEGPGDIKCRIIYVPTPQAVVEKMLDMAKVTDKDHVFDLGCGDGRVVATAAKKFKAKGVGVDIDPARIKDSHKTIKDMQVDEKMVEIRQGDALKVKDLDKASVIILYMLPEFMEKLEKQVLEKLKPGSRIVAHDYPFPNWKADQVVEYKGPEREHTLYMWTVKEKK